MQCNCWTLLYFYSCMQKLQILNDPVQNKSPTTISQARSYGIAHLFISTPVCIESMYRTILCCFFKMHTSSKRHQSSFMAYSHQKGTFERRPNGALVFVTMQLSSLNWLLKLHISTLNWFSVQVVVSTGHQVSGRFHGINKHAGSHTNLLKLLPIQSNLLESENVDLPLRQRLFSEGHDRSSYLFPSF